MHDIAQERTADCHGSPRGFIELSPPAEGVKKSRPAAGGGLARLCRLLCGKPPAFRQAAEPKGFIGFFFWQAGPERLLPMGFGTIPATPGAANTSGL